MPPCSTSSTFCQSASLNGCENAGRPSGHELGNLQRLPVAGVLVHVDHARHDLVIGVERRPHVLEFPQPVELLGGERAQVAILRLARGQHRHQLVRLGADEFIAGARVEHRARREIVPDVMAAQLAVRPLPTAQRIGIRSDSRSHSEVMRQPVVGKGIEIAPVQLHRLFPEAGQQPHIGHRKRLRLPLTLATAEWVRSFVATSTAAPDLFASLCASAPPALPPLRPRPRPPLRPESFSG